MQLYGSYTSPFVRHCRVALAQQGVNFDFVEADYGKSAADSPTAKVPYLRDGDLSLTDSASIIKYVREKSGEDFLADLNDYENFAMTNTVLDSAINLFLLENEGYTPAQVKYLARQSARVASGLAALNERFADAKSRDISRDGALRCACFLAWALFRKRVVIDKHANLIALLEAANSDANFAATAPPAG